MHLTPEGVPLLSILQAAGWPIIPLLLVSIVALALMLFVFATVVSLALLQWDRYLRRGV